MMSKLIEILRVVLISPEALLAFLVYISGYLFPQVYEIIGDSLFVQNNGQEKVVFGFLTPLLAIDFPLMYKMFFPQNKNEVFLNWPGFWRLKIRVWFSFFVCCISIFSVVIVWIFRAHIGLKYLGLLYSICIVATAMTVVTMIKGTIDLRIILEKYHNGDQKNTLGLR